MLQSIRGLARAGSVRLAVALPMALWCGAQETKPSFSASILAPQTTLASGSDIRIDITLKSESNELVFVGYLRGLPEIAGIVVHRSDGSAVEPKEDFKLRPGMKISGFAAAIPPGKSVTEAINLSRWFDLIVPGKYEVQLQKGDHVSGSIVKSNTLTIEVTPASS
jgi:hypothetical protein